MSDFATADDFAARIGLTLSADEATRVTTLLGMASGLIRDAIGQTVSLVADDTLTMPGTLDDRIALPERPVQSVTSVAIDDVAIDDWYLDGDVIYRKPRLVDITSDDGFVGSELYPVRTFGNPARTLTIVYTHGYAPGDVPEVCRSTALEMVARVWVNPGNLVAESIGNVQSTYAQRTGEAPRGLALMEVERRDLRRTFGSRAGGVWVGN